MIILLFITIWAVEAYYDYAQMEVMSEETRQVLNRKMWGLDFTKIPKHVQRDTLALMYVHVK
jgi:hypothetical protein